VPEAGDRGVGDADPRFSAVFGRPLVLRRLVQVLVGLVVLLVLVFAYQATRTALALHRAKTDAATLSGQVTHDDVVGARKTLRDLAHQAAVAHSHSGNVLWAAASKVPWIGGDVHAVRVASSALDATSRNALPDALGIYEAVDKQQLRTADGKFNTAAIARLTPRFAALQSHVTPAVREINAVDVSSLNLSAVRDATRSFQTRLDSLATLARAGSIATRVMPNMLGAHGPRTYLLVEQNNAEIRATGGLPGSFSLLTARDGHIRLGSQLSDTDFPVLTSGVLPQPKGERSLYTDLMMRDVREANATPDFPRAAQIIEAMYAKRYGHGLDGVVFLDPIVLSALMQATGPVAVDGETFHADDVVRKLLNTAYLRFPEPARQDVYFASAAKGIFDRLSSRPVSPTAVVRALTPMVDQRRFLVWSRHPAERAALAGTPLSGELPTGDKATTRAGMYLNGATNGKMEYYLDYVGGVRSVSCTDQGVQQFEARMRLRSNAPRDISGLPDYIVGNGHHVTRGSMLDRFYIYGPAGGRITGIVANGKKLPVFLLHNAGRPVAFLSLILKAQESIAVTARFETGPGHRADPTLDWTPGMHPGATSVTAPSTCG
jgi:Protein of unknown function (DUF4012)